MAIIKRGNRIDFTGKDASALAKKVLPSMQNKEQKSEPANGWISVKDKPQKDGPYLVTQFDVNEAKYSTDDYQNRVWLARTSDKGKTWWIEHNNPTGIMQVYGILFYQPIPSRP